MPYGPPRPNDHALESCFASAARSLIHDPLACSFFFTLLLLCDFVLRQSRLTCQNSKTPAEPTFRARFHRAQSILLLSDPSALLRVTLSRVDSTSIHLSIRPAVHPSVFLALQPVQLSTDRHTDSAPAPAFSCSGYSSAALILGRRFLLLLTHLVTIVSSRLHLSDYEPWLVGRCASIRPDVDKQSHSRSTSNLLPLHCPVPWSIFASCQLIAPSAIAISGHHSRSSRIKLWDHLSLISKARHTLQHLGTISLAAFILLPSETSDVAHISFSTQDALRTTTPTAGQKSHHHFHGSASSRACS